jgi:hypothetical protein
VGESSEALPEPPSELRSRGDCSREIFGEATVAVGPGEEALNDPGARENLETNLIGDLADDLDGDGSRVCDPLTRIASCRQTPF